MRVCEEGYVRVCEKGVVRVCEEGVRTCEEGVRTQKGEGKYAQLTTTKAGNNCVQKNIYNSFKQRNINAHNVPVYAPVNCRSPSHAPSGRGSTLVSPTPRMLSAS